jgi:EmrB/QacA subfamily drug resistance transporter
MAIALASQQPGGERASARTGLAYKWLVMICMLPGITMFMLDLTIVNVALARLSTNFGVDLATVQWVITAFALAMGVATPLADFLERRFTLKRVWIVGLAAFTAASAFGGIAPNFWMLILARAIQGFTGGALLPLILSTLFAVFPEKERGQAMGFLAIPMVAGPALGPTLGGYLVTYWSWRLVFYVNVPVGIASVLLAILFLRQTKPHLGGRFDWWGFVLSSLGFGLTLYGLSEVGSYGWGSLWVRTLIGTGLVSLIVLVGYELMRPDPLLDFRFFRSGQFVIGNIVMWVGMVALLGAEFMLPLYLQNLRGLTAVDAGLMLMPQGFAVAFSGPLAGRLLDRIGARWIVLVGFAVLAFNTYQLSQITLTTDYGTLRWLLVMRGLALGLVMSPPQLTALAAVPDKSRTNASSLLTALKTIAQSFGVATLATLVQSQSTVHARELAWQVRPETLAGQALASVGAILQQNLGLSDVAANGIAVALMLGRISQQAAVLGFADGYRATFAIAVIALLLATFLPGRGATKSDSAAAIAA